MSVSSVCAHDVYSAGDYSSVTSSAVSTRADSEKYAFVGDGRWRTLQLVQSARVRALKPFTVDFERSDGLATVSHESSELYGAGRNLVEARRDFSRSALELFEFLSALRPEELGPLPQSQLQVLRAHLALA